MFNTIYEALEQAGMDVQETRKRIEKFSDIKYPFGDPFCRVDEVSYEESSKGYFDMIDGAIDSLQTITVKQLRNDYPLLGMDVMFEYLKHNIDRVRVVPSDTAKYIEGYTVAFFKYSRKYKRIEFFTNAKVVSSVFHRSDREAIQLYETKASYSSELLMYMFDLLESFEFIPLFVDDSLPVIEVSEKTPDGVYEMLCPVLGERIINTESIMNKLSRYVSRGFYILRGNLYTIIRDKDEYTLELIDSAPAYRDADYVVRIALTLRTNVRVVLLNACGREARDKYRSASLHKLYHKASNRVAFDSLYQSGDWQFFSFNV